MIISPSRYTNHHIPVLVQRVRRRLFSVYLHDHNAAPAFLPVQDQRKHKRRTDQDQKKNQVISFENDILPSLPDHKFLIHWNFMNPAGGGLFRSHLNAGQKIV